jgi:LAO/AO transport system kinase
MYAFVHNSHAAQQQVEAIRAGDVRALSRAITLAENRDPTALPILRAAFPYTGRAKTVGITGPPGVGKSTLAGSLASQYAAQGRRAAILAVDPSSPFSGGALLGDRIRMQVQAGRSSTYIRSMATRGHLGGLASATAEIVDLLDAAGFDRILIESVGAGQDEVDISFLADVLVLLIAPGLGDSVQLMKSGLNEIGDIFAINKCDGPGLGAVEEDVRAALELGRRKDCWRVPVALVAARSGTGIASLLDFIEAYLSLTAHSGASEAQRIERWKMRILRSVREAIHLRLHRDSVQTRIAKAAEQAFTGRVNPYQLVETLVSEIAERTEACGLERRI